MIRQEMIELIGWRYNTMTDEQQDTLSRVEYIVEVAVLRERFRILRVLEELDKDAGDRHNYYAYALHCIREKT